MDRHSVQDNVPEEKADDYRLVEVGFSSLETSIDDEI
jgi:hypothetical protein